MSMETRETPLEDEPRVVPSAGEEHAHPGPRVYVKVAIILAVVTAGEVGLYYIGMANWLLITLLVFFAAVKFALVALFFMHLRFDSPIFRRLFITGIVLAGAVYFVVLATLLLR